MMTDLKVKDGGERTPEEVNEIKRIRSAALAAAAALESFDALAQDYIKATGVTQTRFSFESCGQVDFMRLLREGRDFRRSTVLKVLQFMAAHENNS